MITLSVAVVTLSVVVFILAICVDRLSYRVTLLEDCLAEEADEEFPDSDDNK
jgi:hypothetical protein